jgi:D-psicose/D-tagatose/L-ribulose 3-epimerase
MGLNVRFGASTWLWTSPFKTDSIDEIFSKISSMGFDAVEIAVEDPSLIDVKKLKTALETYKLEPVICGAFGTSRDLTNEDESVHRNCFSYIESCFKICNAVGAKFLAGPMYSAVGKARMIPPEQRKKEWALAVKNIRRVSELAAARNLMIGLEPLNRFESDLINSVDDVLRLINDVGHPAARIVLDGFHMNIEERDIVQAITMAGDKLIHMQVSENYRGTPGTGQTRWEDYRKGLELINYQGVVSIESFTPENQELAGAVCFWHPMAESQDGFAIDGLKFLKKWAE